MSIIDNTSINKTEWNVTRMTPIWNLSAQALGQRREGEAATSRLFIQF